MVIEGDSDYRIDGSFIYPLISMLVFFSIFGAYDLPVRLVNVFKAVVVGALFWLLVLWPFGEAGNWVASMVRSIARDMIMYGSLAVLVVGVVSRLMLHFLGLKNFSMRTLDRKRILAIGSEEEAKHAFALLWQTHFGLGRQIEMNAGLANSPDAVKQIRRSIRKHGIDEVVFCSKDLKWGRIIELIEELKRSGVMFKMLRCA